MKSYESTLAFLHSRRLCRLSSSILQPTVYSKRTSIFISLLSIFSLLSSVAVAQQQRIPSSSFSFTNGSSAISGTTRRRYLSSSTIPISLSTTSTTYELDSLTITTAKPPENAPRSPAILVVVIIICSLMTMITIVGNLVVILSVCLVRKLRTASNILIVSLAVSDVLVGLFIMPLAMVLEIFNNEWKLGSIMCDLWTSTDVLLCTASILNFLVISIDRYCIINHPFKYAPMRKVKLLLIMIAGVWILSALVSLPPILGWGRPSKRLPTCVVNETLEYQIFATMLSFYIPLIVVLIIYANIYRTAQTAMDNRSSVQMSQFTNHNVSSTNVAQPNVTTPLAQQQLNGNSCSSPHLLLSVSNANNNNPNQNDDNISLSGNEQRLGGRRTVKRSTNNSNASSRPASFLSPARCLGRRISTPFNGRLSIFVTRRYSFFRHVQLPNQKAIRTLGVILGAFIICWLPFMLFAIIKPLHERITGLRGPPRKINAPFWLDSVLLWFGYSSSMFNPIIYSKFNREFRTPFREILYCRCRGLNEKIRRQDYLENLYGDAHLDAPPPPTHNHHHHQQQQQGGAGSLEAAV
jgi:5-hydroxytryptamine receptor 7